MEPWGPISGHFGFLGFLLFWTKGPGHFPGAQIGPNLAWVGLALLGLACLAWLVLLGLACSCFVLAYGPMAHGPGPY